VLFWRVKSLKKLYYFQEFFEDLIKYVTSGPCRVLVLTKGETGKGIVSLWRKIIGPFDAAVAREKNEKRYLFCWNTVCFKHAFKCIDAYHDTHRQMLFVHFEKTAAPLWCKINKTFIQWPIVAIRKTRGSIISEREDLFNLRRLIRVLRLKCWWPLYIDFCQKTHSLNDTFA